MQGKITGISWLGVACALPPVKSVPSACTALPAATSRNSIAWAAGQTGPTDVVRLPLVILKDRHLPRSLALTKYVVGNARQLPSAAPNVAPAPPGPHPKLAAPPPLAALTHESPAWSRTLVATWLVVPLGRRR